MQETSALYRTILIDPNHWFETAVIINEDDISTAEKIYGEDVLLSVETNQKLCDESAPSVGNCPGNEITLSMLNPQEIIPAMAKLIPHVRVCRRSSAAVETSEWLKQGVYYVDTRELTHNNNGFDKLTLHGYDAMLKLEEAYPEDTENTYPLKDVAVVEFLAQHFGFEVDAQTRAVMTNGYMINLPASYTCREVLGFLAGAYCGNFSFTNDGRLRLLPLNSYPPETELITEENGFTITFGDGAAGQEEVRLLVREH